MPELFDLSSTPDAPMSPWKTNVSVTGLTFHRKSALSFADAVANATEAQAEFGLRLESDPDNPADPKAMRVVGYAKPKLMPGEVSFHLGYLPKRVGGEINRRAAQGQQFAAKLRAIDFKASEGHADAIRITLDLYSAIAATAEPQLLGDAPVQSLSA